MPADSAGARGEGDIVEHAHVRKEPVVLEHETDGALSRLQELAGSRVVDHLTVEQNLTARYRHESGHRVEQGGLAGAVRPENSQHLAGGRCELDPQRELATDHFDVDVQPLPDPKRHWVEPPRSHLSRIVTSTVTDTSSSTRLSTMAASGSVSSA